MDRIVDRPPVPSLMEEAVSYARRGGWGDRSRDLVHDTIIGVCVRKPQLHGERLRAYFYGALKKNALQLSRRRATRARCDVDWKDYELRRRLQRWRAAEPEEMDIRRAFCRLSEADRQILVLRHREGMTHEEVASTLNIRPATARQRSRRAAQRLKELLDPAL